MASAPEYRQFSESEILQAYAGEDDGGYDGPRIPQNTWLESIARNVEEKRNAAKKRNAIKARDSPPRPALRLLPPVAAPPDKPATARPKSIFRPLLCLRQKARRHGGLAALAYGTLYVERATRLLDGPEDGIAEYSARLRRAIAELENL